MMMWGSKGLKQESKMERINMRVSDSIGSVFLTGRGVGGFFPVFYPGELWTTLYRQNKEP